MRHRDSASQGPHQPCCRRSNVRGEPRLGVALRGPTRGSWGTVAVGERGYSMGTGTGVCSECGSGEVVLDRVVVYAGVRVSLILRYEASARWLPDSVAYAGSERLMLCYGRWGGGIHRGGGRVQPHLMDPTILPSFYRNCLLSLSHTSTAYVPYLTPSHSTPHDALLPTP